MATRYPLIANSNTNQIQEIPFGDTLDLRGNDVNQLVVTGVSTLGNLQISSGIVTATTGIITYYGDGSKLTGVINTMNTGRLLGRSTAGTGAPEEITVGTGLSLSGGTLTATATGGGTKTLRTFTPLDNQPPAANFATLDTRNSIALLDFDAATEESAVFVGNIPEGATLTSGITVRLSWAATTATSGDCVWGVQFEKTTGQNIDSDGFDTATTGTTTTNAASGFVNTTTITCTSIDSLAAGDCYRVKVYRAATAVGDTMTGDAELVTVELRQVA